jgi:hypothetical protein
LLSFKHTVFGGRVRFLFQFMATLRKLPVTLACAAFQLPEACFEGLHLALRLGSLRHGKDRQNDNPDDETKDDENGETFHAWTRG